MNQLSITDGDKMDEPVDIKAAFVVDEDTNFLHCVPSSIVGESQDIANGHNLQSLPQVGDVIAYDSNGCENNFTASIVQGEGSATQIVGLTDKCDQIFDIRGQAVDGFEVSESTESIAISNGSAVGQYLAGFSVNDINEDDSMSFIVNETESNHPTNIQLGCAVIDSNNELVPAVVDMSESTPGEAINTNDIQKSPEKSDSQICDTTNETSERNESEILRVDEEQTVDTAVDETHHSNGTPQELPLTTENDRNAEDASTLCETTPMSPADNSVEAKIQIKNVSSQASQTEDPKVPLITISSDSDSEYPHHATKTANRFCPNASYTCHLCDISFKEAETLNEHMILHRNNRIIETKVRDKVNVKPRFVSCYICKKQLPMQSLQSHIATHKKKKPFNRKEFNSNIRNRRFGPDQCSRNLSSAMNRNLAQKVDFGRLSGPLIIKRLLISGKNDANVDRVNRDAKSSSVFSNAENVVMNPARFIVRVDRMDANTVKRRIASPDISIDESFEKKRRVSLSPLALNRNDVKLDEIENIILDNSDDEKADDEMNRVDEIEPPPVENVSQHGKLTEDELFALLDDESPKTVDKSDERRLSSATSSLQPAATVSPCAQSPLSCEDENGEDLWSKYDAFDLAFHKVALRRLALLRKRASETDGKVDRKYLLGPRFWRKTVRRAELRQVELEPTNTAESVEPVASAASFDGNNRLDDRETNDMTKLQARAERKFRCVLNKLLLSNNPNGVNLWGPLYWRRTLRLAGVRTPADLKLFLKDTPTDFDGIEFVDANEIARLRLHSRTKRVEPKKRAGLEFLHTPTNEPKRIVDEPSSHANSPARVIDLTSPPKASLGSTSTIRSSDMLYESLTKRKDNTIVRKSPTVSKKAIVAQPKVAAQPKPSVVQTPKPEILPSTAAMEKVLERMEENKAALSTIVQSEDPVLIEGDYILNVDGTGALQLVSTSKIDDDKAPLVATEGLNANYMLISDEAGNMQYVLNVPAREGLTNLQFFDGGGNVVVGGENEEQRQFTYAVQFDGENCTAMPVISNADAIMTLPNVGDEQTKSKMNSVGLVGRELSDFINLDLTSAMESGQTDNNMPTS